MKKLIQKIQSYISLKRNQRRARIAKHKSDKKFAAVWKLLKKKENRLWFVVVIACYAIPIGFLGLAATAVFAVVKRKEIFPKKPTGVGKVAFFHLKNFFRFLYG